MKNFFGKLYAGLGKKVIIALVGLLVSSLRAQYPELPLPSDDLIRDVVVALLSAHTLTDVVAIIKTGAKEVVKDVIK